MLTNNNRRTGAQVNAANPRSDNRFGISSREMLPEGGDHAPRTRFTVEHPRAVRRPSVAAVGATFHPNTTKDGWFGMPDNCAVDAMGRLWIATDGNAPSKTGRADGVWAIETEGEARGTLQALLSRSQRRGAVRTRITPDMETFFVAIHTRASRMKTIPMPSRRRLIRLPPVGGFQARRAATAFHRRITRKAEARSQSDGRCSQRSRNSFMIS